MVGELGASGVGANPRARDGGADMADGQFMGCSKMDSEKESRFGSP